MRLSFSNVQGAVAAGLSVLVIFLQENASPDAFGDAAEGGTRASILLAGLLKVMLGYQRCMPESLAEAKLDATRLLPKVGHAHMHE